MSSSNRLPGAGTTLKVTEGLGELQRLGDDTLLLLIVSDFGVTGQGEVLAQRVSLETVVGHDSSKIRVTGEEDTVKVVHLSLVPVGTVKESGDTGNGRGLIGVGLDTDSGVVTNREKIVDDFESVLARGVVGSSDCADLSELSGGVVCSVLAGVL